MDAVTLSLQCRRPAGNSLYSARYVRHAQSFAGSGSRKANWNRLFRLHLCFLLLLVKSTMARHYMIYCHSGAATAQWVVDRYPRPAR